MLLLSWSFSSICAKGHEAVVSHNWALKDVLGPIACGQIGRLAINSGSTVLINKEQRRSLYIG